MAPKLEALDSISLPRPPDLRSVLADSFNEARSPESAEDVERLQHLQGIYVKQVGDRVARQLRMLIEPLAQARGRCVVSVVQNEDGHVLEVDTRDCERSVEERDQVARAIRAASPLPLPPEGLAGGSYLTLDVTAL